MKTQMTAEELLEIKDVIERAKSKISELKGQKINYMESLTHDFGCNSVIMAEKKVITLDLEITDISEIIEEKTEKLQKDFPQLFEN